MTKKANAAIIPNVDRCFCKRLLIQQFFLQYNKIQLFFKYVSGSYSNSVYRFDDVTGNFIDIFIPTGSGGLYCPNGLNFGPDGLLYVSSQSNDSILRYNGTTGAFIDTFVLPASDVLDETSDLLFYTSSTPIIPEPATMLLLGSGLIGLAGFRKKLKK